MPSAAHSYYGALVGNWSGVLRLVVTDASVLAGLDVSMRAMGLFSKLGGTLSLATTLHRGGDVDGLSTFVHTTRASKLGMTLFASEETITLAPEDDTIVMRGVQRVMSLTGAKPEPYEGPGRISPDGTSATYHLHLGGQPLVQRTLIVPEGLRLVQETPWSKSEVLLRRRRA